MTIRRRIAIVAAAAVAVTVVFVSAGAFVAARRQIMVPIDQSLLSRATIIENVQPGTIPPGFRDDFVNREGIFVQRRGDFDSTYYQVILPGGGTINAGADDVVLPVPSPDEVSMEDPKLRSVWVDGLHLRVVTVFQPDARVFIQMGRPLTEADETLRRLAGMLAVAGLVGIAVAGGLGLLVARSALKPIDDLRSTIADIAASKSLGERVDVLGRDEIADLGTAFNGLLDEIEAARADQVRLVRDAGHELRTPLTALRTNIEILQRHEVDEADRQTMLAAAHAEVEELSTLVTEVVDLATDRYEEEPTSRVVLGEVVAAVAERLERRNGRRVRIADDGSAVVGKTAALDRAITNIVTNADKWSPRGDPIEVTVSSGCVTVTDTGPGFEPEDIDHVFERFYRSTEARSTPGSGLGLSIVRQVVEDHDGEVFVRNRSDGRGAVVGFCVPLA